MRRREFIAVLGAAAAWTRTGLANGRRSERQDAGAGPFEVPVVQAFMRRRRAVAAVAPPLVGWRWALGPRSSHAGVPHRIGGMICPLGHILGLHGVVLELRDRPDAGLAGREKHQHRYAVGAPETLTHLGPAAHRAAPVVRADARDAAVLGLVE